MNVQAHIEYICTCVGMHISIRCTYSLIFWESVSMLAWERSSVLLLMFTLMASMHTLSADK